MEQLKQKTKKLKELKEDQDRVLSGPKFEQFENLDGEFKKLADQFITLQDYERISRFDGI